MAPWLLAIPVAVCLWFIHYRSRWPAARRDATRAAGASLSRRSRSRRDFAVLLLTLLALGTGVLAMMRPQIRREGRIPTYEPRNLIVILDRSVSMRARDVVPSRIERAVEETGAFLRLKPEGLDRVALVGFADTPVVLSYATADTDSLAFYLEWLREDPTPFFGTDMGAALLMARDVARREARGPAPLFVIISDGEDQSARLEGAAATLRREALRVHSAGIGTTAAAAMPLAVGDGRDEFLRDAAGRLLTTTFDETTLRRIAAVTGGRYFGVSQPGELLAALVAITTAERRQTGWSTTVDYRDIYLLLLATAGAATFLLATLL
jgi:Ca-activated chloride channel family protein